MRIKSVEIDRAVTRRSFLVASGSALAVTGLAYREAAAQAAPSDPPRSVRAVMEEQVARGVIPGAVWLVARGPHVHVDSVGVTAFGGSTPMGRDTIFRIASMTKAVTATAVMMLVEDGKLTLDAPVERWLPELANRQVLRALDGPVDDTVPAERPITLHDLMSFTFGFGLQFDLTLPIQRAIDDLQLANGEPVPMTPHDPDEWMRRLGTLPLMYQPGAQFLYNTGSLVLGVLVARVSGQSFDSFVRERIFGPLGMDDTDFFVPPSKLDRFAGIGSFTNPETGEQSPQDADGAASAYAKPPVFPSGAAGLVSTADDFLSFARMLLNDGVHRRRRLLSARSVRRMTSDRLTPEQRAASSFDYQPDFFATRGWGYGVAVYTEPDAISRVPGRYGWDGGFGTSWVNDPNRDQIGVVLTQSADFLFSGALESFWSAVYRRPRLRACVSGCGGGGSALSRCVEPVLRRGCILHTGTSCWCDGRTMRSLAVARAHAGVFRQHTRRVRRVSRRAVLRCLRSAPRRRVCRPSTARCVDRRGGARGCWAVVVGAARGLCAGLRGDGVCGR
jgi:CubicO group peptidase (beta-lactamase class C family)